MNATTPIFRCWRPGPARFPVTLQPRFLPSSSLTQRAYYSDQVKVSRQKTDCHAKKAGSAPSVASTSRSPWRLPFWSCRTTWRRAGINTLRCLAGCTLGDFSALWMLQTYYPELGMTTIMAASMVSGITTSIIVETILLRRGADQLSWPIAVRTAMGMSMVSMVAMETAENIVDYHLTGGVVALGDPNFWMAAAVSMAAGYLAPLPYNYLRLRKYGKACH
ncbi:uncharacterized protein TRIVIDRAFT_39766 [Trichoderma virens Gv29-8]|uniref:DUF4396 domain-containing protein n=1 Tax=Hypocrea virens (strain Gv29-8 / FGSC 10586) TaxID=413071 RepID=G9NBK7_HYPVG|nr:uncharacterized protein TRIVIDRAFT_39766 [Trichoderma virens Gv29-8]EHK16212.1 hypothetical protein TRIVIDRAFT_39766 [Trichoderma virens Gv29-8]UKZ56012.1 hypothetical protein TrVGV298_009836 [Trichoderma virens]